MITKFEHSMETLGSNSLFNASGLATVLSFLTMRILQVLSLADIEATITIAVGGIGVIWGLMRVYLTYLETKKFKRDNPEKKENKK